MQKRLRSAAKVQQDALRGIQAEAVSNATPCMEQRRGKAGVRRCKGQPAIESLHYRKDSKPA